LICRALKQLKFQLFVMLRRLLLVAWFGSQAETELAKSMGLAYSQGTSKLCEDYLSKFL
jgi:hypothetical protein